MQHRSLKRTRQEKEAKKKFKVDDLLGKKSKESLELDPQTSHGFMTLTFLGYYEKKGKQPTLKLTVSTPKRAKFKKLANMPAQKY